MEERKFIIGTKKNRAKLISAVFVLENGTELTESKLDHIHEPVSTLELDQILGILGPSPQRRYSHSK